MKKSQGGFIDPFSLLSLGFLLLTLVVTTTVTSNTKVSRDLRGKAYSITNRCPNGALAPDGDVSLCPENQVSQPQTVEPVTPIQNDDEPQAPQTSTDPDVPNGVCLEPGQSCQNGNYFDSGCPVTETRCGTKPVQTAQRRTITPQKTIAPIQTITPTQTVTEPEAPDVPNGVCLEPGQSCKNGNYFDIGCPVTETRCGTKPVQTTCNISYISDLGCGKGGCKDSELAQYWKATDCLEKIRCVASSSCVTSSTAITPNTQSPPSCSSFGICYSNTYTCEKSYGQLDCGTGKICGNHCSAPVVAPVRTTVQTQTTATPSTYTLNMACKTCNSNKQCVSRTKPCNEDLNQCETHEQCGTVWVCQTNETQCQDTQTLKTCKSDQTGWLSKTCEYGCENSACKTKPDEALCNSPSECQSGQCFASAAYYQGTTDANGLSAAALSGSVKRCHKFTPQDYKDIQAAENQGNLMAGMVAASFIPGVGPVLQFAGAASNAVNAYYTCSQIDEATNAVNAITKKEDLEDARKQLQQLKTQCGLYIAGAVTSTIAGGSMAAAGNQTLTTIQQLAFSAVNLTDSGVNTVIADQQRQIVCDQNPSSSACTMAYMQEGLGIGGLAVGAANTATNGFDIVNNSLLSGLDASGPGYGSLGNSSGLTIISRSNMPNNLTPQEQALWIARYSAAENYTGMIQYDTHLSTTENVGYQPGSASEIYQPTSLNQAVNNAPDPTGYLAYLDELANAGKTPAEIAALSRQYIQQQGINIINNPTLQTINGNQYAMLDNGTATYWPSNLNSYQEGDSIGIFTQPNIGRALTQAGTPMAAPTTPYNPYNLNLSDQPSILINPSAERALSPEFIAGTTAHEFGHYVESNLLPPSLVQTNGYNAELQRIELEPPELLRASTEYLSSLYKIRYAQSLAPTSVNLSIDNMNGNLLLNSWVVNGGPGYLTTP